MIKCLTKRYLKWCWGGGNFGKIWIDIVCLSRSEVVTGCISVPSVLFLACLKLARLGQNHICHTHKVRGWTYRHLHQQGTSFLHNF